MAVSKVATSPAETPRLRVRSADVALRAGVSRSTVSVVLNGRRHPIIAEETRERVRQAARDLNYRPNQLARALITGTSRLIGLWMWSLPSPYAVSLIQHALTDIRQDGFQALLFEAVPNDSSGAKFGPAHWPIDGMITVVERELIARFLAEHPTPPPIVSIGAGALDFVDNVQFDMPSGVRQAMDHLTTAGRRRIVFVAAADAGEIEERYRSYRQYCGEAAIPCLPVFVDLKSRPRENVMAVVREWIGNNGCPDAFLCFNDEVAIAVNRQLRDLKISVPVDAAIIGCDDWIESQYQTPQLSTIKLPIEEACRVAWTFLRNRMADPTIARQQSVLGTRLVVRESSAPSG